MRGLFFITGNLLLYKFSKSLTVTSRITVFRMARESALLLGVTFTLIDILSIATIGVISYCVII